MASEAAMEIATNWTRHPTVHVEDVRDMAEEIDAAIAAAVAAEREACAVTCDKEREAFERGKARCAEKRDWKRRDQDYAGEIACWKCAKDIRARGVQP